MSEWKLYVGLALILGGAGVIFLTNSTLFKDGTTVQGTQVTDVNFGLPAWLGGAKQQPSQSKPIDTGIQVKVMSCDSLGAIITNDYRHRTTDASMSTQEHSEMHKAYNRCLAVDMQPSNSTAIPEFVCKGEKICVKEILQTIADADTLYTNEHKIRLSLSNAPEKGRDGYKEATAFITSICPIGSELRIDQDDFQHDTVSSITAKVFCGDKLLNSELLYNNHAVILKQYCGQSEFANERWAKDFGC